MWKPSRCLHHSVLSVYTDDFQLSMINTAAENNETTINLLLTVTVKSHLHITRKKWHRVFSLEAASQCMLFQSCEQLITTFMPPAQYSPSLYTCMNTVKQLKLHRDSY